MTKILIYPDIHNKGIVTAESVVELENPDYVVFLGDYFDSFGDERNVELVSSTAKWLEYSTKQNNRIHLFGNHDLWYSHGEGSPYCAGNSEFKYFVIKQFFKDWSKLKFTCWVDDWLCTHAGLSYLTYQYYEKTHTVLDLTNEINTLGRKHPLTSLCGEMRGGIECVTGGILWCHCDVEPRYSEFMPIDGVKQIFGHTASEKPKIIDDNNICIDTFGQYYGLYNGKDMKIKSVKDLKI